MYEIHMKETFDIPLHFYRIPPANKMPEEFFSVFFAAQVRCLRRESIFTIRCYYSFIAKIIKEF